MGSNSDKDVRDGALGPVVAEMGPALRAEFEKLQASEARILKALSDPKTAAAFAADPGAAMANFGIDVPPIIKQRLKLAAGNSLGQRNTFGARKFRLPDGTSVTARVNIHFTGAPRED
jgi:hypothetical protein